MNGQLALGFSRRVATYPITAGFKRRGTSVEAAQSINAETLRETVLGWLRAHGPHTADEAAAVLGETVLAIRPRFSELKRLGRIVETEQRRKNTSGRSAIVWRAT